MADAPGVGPGERPARRRFRDRRGDDYVVDLFRQALAALDDPDRVNRILAELGRLYNPLTDRPIVELATRQRVMGLLAAGARPEATHLLQDRMYAYAPVQDVDGSPEPRASE